MSVNALWDTGATSCAISEKLAQELKIESTENVNIFTSGGKIDDGKQCQITIEMSNEIGHRCDFANLKCLITNLNTHDVQCIIGMNVIASGEFHILNTEAGVVFQFSINDK